MSVKYIHILIEHTMKNGRATDKGVIGVYSSKKEGEQARINTETISSNKEFRYTVHKWCVR